MAQAIDQINNAFIVVNADTIYGIDPLGVGEMVYIYIYIYMCVCVCMEGKRERERRVHSHSHTSVRNVHIS